MFRILFARTRSCEIVSVEEIHDRVDRPVVGGRALVRPVAVYPGVLHQRALVHHHVVDLA